MSNKILITTTSFQDTPGSHHQLIEETGWEIITARGPLGEDAMLELVGDIDGLICGDDDITKAVLKKSLPKLKVISKYGIGVDKIDVDSATQLGLPVCFTPGVNHTTVAEHCFALLLALEKNLYEEVSFTKSGNWKRLIGHEIMGKTIGIVGLGRIGREVAIRAKAFGMDVVGFDLYWPEEFANQYDIKREGSIDAVLSNSDVVSLHTNLTAETRNMINSESIEKMKDGALLINCARGELVDVTAMKAALDSGKLGGYGTDVLDVEPPSPDHPLLNTKNCIVTPHIGSRTYESVVRQATKSVENLILASKGEKPLAQVNDVPTKSY